MQFRELCESLRATPSRPSRPLLTCLLASLTAFFAAGTTSGQGLLVDVSPDRQIRLPRIVPRPEPGSYQVRAVDLEASITDSIAQVQVSQTFVNTGSSPLEVCFVFPLPYDGAVDQLTLLVDGKETPARLLPAEEARKLYEEIVRKNQDPALLEWIGQGMFKTSVFPVPPGAERKVMLRYSQACRRDQGVTDFLFPLQTAKYTSQPLESLSIRCAVETSQPLKNIYSPTHEVEIERPDDRHAVLKVSLKNYVPTRDFRLLFDIGDAAVETSVLSYRPTADEDGYFLLMASPQLADREQDLPEKTVLFVVDRSGSMSGDKIRQAKNALRFVLNQLREGDTFNIIAYDTNVVSFRPEIQRFDDETRQAAIGFVEGLNAGGGTNIDEALQVAMSQLRDSERSSYIVFLTDGLPTAGVQNEAKIVARVKQANHVRGRLFAFGVGYDVNSRLLDKLVRQNFGQSEYVRPSEDIEVAVSKLYQRIESPVLTDVTLTVDVEGATIEQGPPISRLYPGGMFDLFAGEQLLIFGRYKIPGAARITVSGSMNGTNQRYESTSDLVEKSNDSTNAFIARLWATRRVGEILDLIDLEGSNDELVQELVSLATEHGIMTPYTSFLADETTALGDLAGNANQARQRADHSFQETAGRLALGGRAAKGQLKRAALLPAADADHASGTYGGFGGGLLGEAAVVRDLETNQNVALTTIRTVGQKTFFFRGGKWIDSTVDDQQIAEARRIERYSREYFDLVRTHGPEVRRYLAMDDPVVVRLGNEIVTW